jgi:hypothetical protein
VNELLIKAFAVAAIVGGAFAAGWGFCSAHNSHVLLAQAGEIAKKEAVTAVSVDKIVTQYVDRIVTKEVKVYVPSKDNTCRVLDGNFRLFYDSAITGLPYTAGDPDAAPSSIDSVAASIAANFDSCAKNSDQLKALQDWARTVSQP